MIRGLALWALMAGPAAAFSFDGPFGTYDPAQLQRGLQVYTEVCSACHGLRQVAIRTLGDADGPALPPDQVRAYAELLGLAPPDRFPASALPEAPDLSLIAKAQDGGPRFVHDVLTGYDGTEVDGLYGNRASGPIAMPPPLVDGMVTYRDGSEATVERMSQDVSAFLMWAAEPKLVARKRAGFVAVGLLLALAGLLYLTNREIWRRQPR
ncbi:cytochrome c1 [Falsirhodobacter sp. 20TX0035]|uniref:cytochrome c1 n=1 Tax=Falsirhodobacter sp. 20TX0035 TaxID=3022019 RepID=UPI00232DCB18|nr:cytochrome c1 [Falsirhodobacter sp. 20TX0035]MDB6452811.1 cytochrome c1 [Falsirhodobacter sp. 20TX0035]